MLNWWGLCLVTQEERSCGSFKEFPLLRVGRWAEGRGHHLSRGLARGAQVRHWPLQTRIKVCECPALSHSRSGTGGDAVSGFVFTLCEWDRQNGSLPCVHFSRGTLSVSLAIGEKHVMTLTTTSSK